MKKLLWTVAVAVVLAAVTTPADAGPFTFQQCVSQNNATSCGAAIQFSVEVSGAGSDSVAFTFRNTAVVSSSITEIYFDDAPPGRDPNPNDQNYLVGNLLGRPTSITNSAGVGFFSGSTNPGELPAAREAWPTPFVTTQFFSADVANTASGVNASAEWVTIVFGLASGKDIPMVEAALRSGELRVGIHVRSFPNGGSETFVTNPVPEPGTLLLLGAGLTGLALRRRRR